MTVYALIEQRGLTPSATRPDHHEIVADISYSTGGEFESALRAAIEALRQRSGPDFKMLAICGHGLSQTGTYLQSAGAGINLWEFKDAFASMPENMLVFVGACWGGYVNAASAIQSGVKKPYVVGPLVDIWSDDADTLQVQLLDLLDNGPPTLRNVYRLVRRFNENEALRQDEYGSRRWIFGMLDPVSKFLPHAAPGAQLAESVEEIAIRFKVKQLIHHGEQPIGDPMLCVVEDERGRCWQATVANIRGLTSVDGVAPGLRFRARYQPATTPDLPPNVTQDTKTGLDAIHFVALVK